MQSKLKEDYEAYIVDCIKSMQGKYTPYQIFSDWIAVSAIAIQNITYPNGEIKEKREEQYRNIISKYSADEVRKLSNMTGALVLAFENRISDILGEIYMKSGCGNKNTGQFFTPYHLSYLTANIVYKNTLETLKSGETAEIYEPSTGGGGMMIAVVQSAIQQKIDYCRKLHITAQDLDWNGVYMTYIQLSILGAKATVVQGDTLHEPYHQGYDEMRVLRTPAEMGAIF